MPEDKMPLFDAEEVERIQTPTVPLCLYVGVAFYVPWQSWVLKANGCDLADVHLELQNLTPGWVGRRVFRLTSADDGKADK